MLRKLLILGRYLLVIPVISSLLLTVGVVVMGAGLIVERGWNLVTNGEFSTKSAKMMSITTIQTIDFFLVGALGYITAVGIYCLFITTDNEPLLKRIKIENLKDLEDKIIGVVVAALALPWESLGTAKCPVSFEKTAKRLNPDRKLRDLTMFVSTVRKPCECRWSLPNNREPA